MPRRVRRHWMLSLVLVPAVIRPAASAQVFAEARLGAQVSSILVRDSINQEITVGAKPAPTAVLSVGTALNERWHLAFGIRWSRSDLTRREAGQDVAMLPLTVWTATLGLRRPLNDWATVEGSVGGIKYAPGGDVDGTIFQDNAPFLPTAGLAARLEKALGARWGIGLELAYDFHRFTTHALREGGIAEHRSVHRAALGIALRGNFTDAAR